MSRSLGLLAILTAFGVPAEPFAQADDMLYLVNGDGVTGRIHNLDRGVLLVTRGPMGRVQMEWPNQAPCARTGDSLPFTSLARMPCTTHVIFTISQNLKN